MNCLTKRAFLLCLVLPRPIACSKSVFFPKCVNGGSQTTAFQVLTGFSMTSFLVLMEFSMTSSLVLMEFFMVLIQNFPCFHVRMRFLSVQRGNRAGVELIFLQSCFFLQRGSFAVGHYYYVTLKWFLAWSDFSSERACNISRSRREIQWVQKVYTEVLV